MSEAEARRAAHVAFGGQDRFAEADSQLLRALAIADGIPDANEAMALCVNRLRILRTQGRSAALAWIEEIDRRHTVDLPNPRAWTQSRFAACETLRDAGVRLAVPLRTRSEMLGVLLLVALSQKALLALLVQGFFLALVLAYFFQQLVEVGRCCNLGFTICFALGFSRNFSHGQSRHQQ